MNDFLPLYIAIFLPIVGSLLAALLGRRLQGRTAWFALAFPVVSIACLVHLAHQAFQGDSVSLLLRASWIPALGIHASFLIDRLSLFYALTVTGIGAVVIVYARYYLGDNTAHQGRFYSYLLLFMGSMLGTVLSNNLMLLFVFWEITGLASFLLIGFSHEKEKSRAGARMALLVTAATGLLMMVGIILLGNYAGTFEFNELLAMGSLNGMGNMLSVAVVLILLGAFGKSAQFPFHFWLPNAMAAPTPVSAYLHSATMVKLGIFLVGRFYPLLSSNGLWEPMLLWTGFFTMALGALMGLMSNDLKAILAYSTVSQLGFLMGLYALGTQHDLYHVMNHVFYKGSLFMMAGVVDHAAKTRDVRQLGGLGRVMPLTFVAAILAGAGMIALPGTTGFVSKELMFGQAFEWAATTGGIAWLWPAAGFFTSACMTAFTLRIVINIFTGRMPSTIKQQFRKPALIFQGLPLLLALVVLLGGLFPNQIEALLPGKATGDLHLWHGWGGPLYISLAGWFTGWLLWKVKFNLGEGFEGVPSILRFGNAFENLVTGFTRLTGTISSLIRANRPMDYLPIIISFVVLLLGGFLLYGVNWTSLNLPGLRVPYPLNSMFVSLVALCVLGVVFMRRWTTRLIALSTVGFLVTFYFMICRAPDLALTQMLIETATLVLMLLLLGRFPESAERNEIADLRMTGRKLFTACLALCMGTIMFFLVISISHQPSPELMGSYFLSTTRQFAKGANAVNTILVDYRGFDTMGEITVLVVSLLGALGLFMRSKKEEEL